MGKSYHREVSELLEKKKKTLSDTEFFTSVNLRKHFLDIIAATTKRYGHRKVNLEIIFSPESNITAYTDNSYIKVNAACELFKGRRVQRYRKVFGAIVHEIGHVLFTDFRGSSAFLDLMENTGAFGKLISPKDLSPEEEVALVEYNSLIKDSRARMFFTKILQQIFNITEDGYIEEKMMKKFPGSFALYLGALRQFHWVEMEPIDVFLENATTGENPVSQAQANLTCMFQLCLEYAKYGKFKYGTMRDSEYIDTMKKIIPHINELMYQKGTGRRKECVHIFLLLWPYIKPLYDEKKEETDDESLSSALSDLIKELSDALEGSSEDPTGSTSEASDDDDGGEEKTSSEKARERTSKSLGADDKKGKKKKSSKTKGKGKAGEEGKEGKDGKKKSKSSKSDDKKETEGFGESEGESEEESDETAGSGDSGEAEGGADTPDCGEGECLEDDGDGSVEFEGDYEGSVDESIISTIESDIATEYAEKKVEAERTDELRKELNDIDFGSLHSSTNAKIFRQSSVSDAQKDAYDRIAPPLIALSKQLQRQVSTQLKDSRTGGRNNGLLMGRRFSGRDAYRLDGRCFSKNNLPEDVPRLAVGVLLDESGSMGNYSRDVAAMKTAIILEDFCRNLEIPCMICGHTTDDWTSTVRLNAYSEFDAIDKNDKYRLTDIEARYDNRDGYAVRYVAERLLKREEEVKLLIVVSDGQPCSPGYRGDDACADLREIKHEYTRRGVCFVAAAIGDDKPQIEECYGDSFLDITNLEELPVTLTSVIKRFIKTR